MKIIKYFTQPRQVTIGEFWIGVLCVFILGGTLAQSTVWHINRLSEEKIEQQVFFMEYHCEKKFKEIRMSIESIKEKILLLRNAMKYLKTGGVNADIGNL